MEKSKTTINITVFAENGRNGGVVSGIVSINPLDALVICRRFVEDLKSFNSATPLPEDESQETFFALEMSQIINIYSSCSAPRDDRANQAISDYEKLRKAIERPMDGFEEVGALL